jgi:hypothetical protein
VTSFRVVLASAEDVPNVAGQRKAPGSLELQSVSYYRQRTVAGGTQGKIDNVDGFAVRIESDPSMSEKEFIPFVLMYDGEKVVGVATYRSAETLQPSPILVLGDEIDKYVLDVEPVVQVGEMDGAAAGQVRVVDCIDDRQMPYTSGIVWRPHGGGEVRLLFPDDGGDDATDRELDLDCDAHPVTAENSNKDCDDSLGWFHKDAQDTCDGFDTNCDGLQSIVVACTGVNVCQDASTTSGVAVCDERTQRQSVCASDPQCACQNGSQTCARCILTSENAATAGKVKPCQPGEGLLHLDMCGLDEPCPKVEVLTVGNGWRAEISPDVQPRVFATSAQNVVAKIHIRVRRPEGAGVEISGTRGTSTGDVMLGIQTADGSLRLMPVDLQLDADVVTAGCGTGPHFMACYP